MLFIFSFLGLSILATALWDNNYSSLSRSIATSPVQKLDYSSSAAKTSSTPPANSCTSTSTKHEKTEESLGKDSNINIKHQSTYFSQSLSSPVNTVYSNTTHSSGETLPVISQRTEAPKRDTAQPSFAAQSNNPDIAEVLKSAVDNNNIPAVKSLLTRPEIAPHLIKPFALTALMQLTALTDDQEAVSVLKEVLSTTSAIDHFVLLKIADTATIHNNTSILKLVLSRPEAKASLQTLLGRQAMSQLATLTDDQEAVEMIKEILNTNHLVSSHILAQAITVAVKHNNTPFLKLLLPHPEIIGYLKASLGPIGAEALNKLIALPNDQEAVGALTEILKSNHPLNNLVLLGMLKAATAYNNVPILKLLLSHSETIDLLQTSLTSVGVSAMSQLAALTNDQEATNLLKEVWSSDHPIWFDRRALPSVLTTAIEHNNKQIIELLLDRIETRYILIEDMLKLLTVATVHNNLDVINCVIANKALINHENLAILNESIPNHALDLLHLAVQRQNNKLVEWLLRQDQIEIKDPQYFLTCILNHSPSSNVLSLFKITHDAGMNKVLINLKDPETEGTILDYVIFKLKILQALVAEGDIDGEISSKELKQNIAEYEYLKEFLIDIGVEHTSDSFEQAHVAHLGIGAGINQHAEVMGDTIHVTS